MGKRGSIIKITIQRLPKETNLPEGAYRRINPYSLSPFFLQDK